jgi:hypothetical protein
MHRLALLLGLLGAACSPAAPAPALGAASASATTSAIASAAPATPAPATPAPATPAPATPALATPATPATLAPAGCSLDDRTTFAFTARSVGVTRLAGVHSLSLAAANDEAILVFTVSGDAGCDHDGCYSDDLAAVRLPAAAPTLEQLPADGSGISPGVDGVALALPTGVAALTQGHEGAVAMGNHGNRAFIVRGGAVTQRFRPASSGAFAAAPIEGGALLAVAGWEPRASEPSPASVRVIAYREGEKKPGSEVVAWGIEGDRFDLPAVAARGGRGAVAFRRERHEGPTAIMAAWIDPASGKPESKTEVLASGPAGAPAVVVAGDRLLVVWDEGRSPSAPRRLRLSIWERGAPRPAAPVDLPVPAPSASAPALAYDGARYLLAFRGGADPRRGVVYFGAAATPEAAAASAAPVSVGAGDAGGPRLALDGDRRGWLAWIETEKGGGNLVAAPVTCH